MPVWLVNSPVHRLACRAAKAEAPAGLAQPGGRLERPGGPPTAPRPIGVHGDGQLDAGGRGDQYPPIRIGRFAPRLVSLDAGSGRSDI
jgi:hypothetical protein